MEVLETQITGKLDQLKADLMEHVKQAIQEKINPLQARVEALEAENKQLRSELSQVKAHAIENEQYSRKCSARIFGLPEVPLEDCRASVFQLCKDKLNAPLVLEDIDVAHRLSTYRQGRAPSPRPIIVKFRFRDTKLKVLKNRRALKGSGTVISDDLSKPMPQLFNRVRNDARVKDCWTWDSKIFVKDHDNRIYRIRYGQPLDSLLQRAGLARHGDT